jgi:SAM-dependent methyltransferase
VSSDFPQQLWKSLRDWWREQARVQGAASASLLLLRELWEFARDSTPERRRQRYGDMEYDWQERVNTTSGTVGWRTRLMGIFHSLYQPTDPAQFQEMMAALPIDFRKFIFIDIGSGKGRALLMAAQYPFLRIVGVELMPELHEAAEENIGKFLSEGRSQVESFEAESVRIESVLGDAREFELPREPLVIYLFNPLPKRAFSEVLDRLKRSLEECPRPVWVVYHNPVLENVLGATSFLEKTYGAPQFSIYKSTSR